GGYFTSVKGKNAYRFATLSKTDGTPIGGFPGYNNIINKISVRGDSILTGGNYTLSGYYSPYSVKLTAASVTPDPNFPATNGIIYDVIADGSGNYYVAGSFTTIGGVNQAYVAKLNSSFQVITGWAPVVNNQVRSLVLSGTTLYIGGLFTTTNSVSRPYISALNTSNPGSNKVWNSSLNSYAYSLVSDGTSIYAGGIFTQVNAITTRDRLAKFDLNGNLDATWNPDATGGGASVEKLAISGTTILAGGSFTTIGGVARNYLAKLNNTTGAATNWATANSYVFSLYVDGTTCYAGGYFTSLTSPLPSTISRNYIGGITISNGAITTFNPNPNSYVFAISKSGTNLYYGGQFTLVNGTDRKYLAANNTSSGALQTWNPSANYIAYSLNIDALNNIFIGGNFSGFQETGRTYASIIKYIAKSLDSWTPVIDNVVYDITYNATKIFIGGAFHNVNGGAKNGLAAFRLNGVVQATNLNLTKAGTGNVSVWSLFATPTTIYAGGDFDKAGADVRNDFVEADISAGAGTVLATNAFADDIVYTIDVQGTTIVYGGNFRFSGFNDRNYLAIIRSATSTVAPWTPLPDSYVFDIALNYNRIFIAGQFDNVGGAPHPGAAAFNLNNGALLTWNPLLTRAGQGYYADLNSVIADSNNVYLGGYFDQANGTTRNNAAAVAASNASLLTWNPGPNYIVRTIAMGGNNLFFGGDFTFCKGASRQYIAKIDSATGLVNATWNPGSNGYIYSLTGSGVNIYAGGSYTQLGGVTRTSLGAVNANTGVTTSFDPVIQQSGSQGTVNTLAFDASNILYAGGTFNTAKGSTRNNLAAFTTTGTGALQAWDPNANTTVNALAISGSTIFAGGNFTTLNGGTARNHLASVNNTNGTLLPFNPNINDGNVNALSFNGTNLYVGGTFLHVNGGVTSRSYLASYNVGTGNLNTWNPVANSWVLGLASASDTVFPGGYFTTLNATTRNRLGGIRGNPGTTLLPFDPNANNIIRSNFIANQTLLTGGAFTTISGTSRSGFVVYSLPALLSSAITGNQSAEENNILANKPAEKAFVLYPNPATTGMVTLQLTNLINGNYTIRITSVDGRKAYQKTINAYGKANTIPLNISTLKNGVYIVNVTGQQTNWSNRLVIIK
ncbi:MAG TPA: T9SS type A sorting domain-containing protein, partial [Panacibacter sp.]|nr:T9SS type A sorting domain-containing protein [Panacibacter sp.]